MADRRLSFDTIVAPQSQNSILNKSVVSHVIYLFYCYHWLMVDAKLNLFYLTLHPHY